MKAASIRTSLSLIKMRTKAVSPNSRANYLSGEGSQRSTAEDYKVPKPPITVPEGDQKRQIAEFFQKFDTHFAVMQEQLVTKYAELRSNTMRGYQMWYQESKKLMQTNVEQVSHGITDQQKMIEDAREYKLYYRDRFYKALLKLHMYKWKQRVRDLENL